MLPRAIPESSGPAGRGARFTETWCDGVCLAGVVAVGVVVALAVVVVDVPLLVFPLPVVLLPFPVALLPFGEPLVPGPDVGAFFFLLAPPPLRFGPFGALPISNEISGEIPTDPSLPETVA